MLFPFPFIRFQGALSRAWDNSFCLMTGQKKNPILRLENSRTFLHGAELRCQKAGFRASPCGLQSTVTSEPEFPSVTSAHPLCWCLNLPRETTAPQRGLERSKLSHQGTHWGCHCPIAKLMTFGEFGNLLLCGGKETKKFKMKLHISKRLLL